MGKLSDALTRARGFDPGTPERYRYGRCWNLPFGMHLCWMPEWLDTGVEISFQREIPRLNIVTPFKRAIYLYLPKR